MKKKAIILILGIFVLLGVTVPSSYVYFASKKYDNLIFNGVKIEGVDLSGKTKEEAVKLIKDKYADAIMKKKITVKTPNKSYDINYNKLNFKFNTEEALKQAFDYGKNLNPYAKYKLITNPVNKEYKIQYSYDNKEIEKTLGIIEKEVNREPENAKLTISNGTFNVTPAKKGIKFKKDVLLQQIVEKMKENSDGDVLVEAPLEETKASITEDKLAQINTKLSSFSTDFSSSNENRANNVELSTRSINGKLIMPGESFSFNDVVGERTAARGYKEAGVIINNQLESGLGGGICQVSSTLYNAVLRANIKATERTHHTIPSSYVGLGFDATVDFGNIDYKFKNTLEYPVYIEGYTRNRNVCFNIYSNSALGKTKYDLSNEVYETVQPKTKEIADPNMYEGEVEIVKKAYTGFRVKVYKNAYENGKLVNQELVSNEYYQPVDGEIKKGTKKKTN